MPAIRLFVLFVLTFAATFAVVFYGPDFLPTVSNAVEKMAEAEPPAPVFPPGDARNKYDPKEYEKYARRRDMMLRATIPPSEYEAFRKTVIEDEAIDGVPYLDKDDKSRVPTFREASEEMKSRTR